MNNPFKEMPNVPGMQIWPSNYVSPEDLEKKKKKRRVVRDFEREKEEKELRWSAFFERIEHYAFILIFAVAWCFIVAKTLKYLRFPVHRHPIEVSVIYVGPILVCIVFLFIIDRQFRKLREKEMKED